jgi:hypothetical protein
MALLASQFAVWFGHIFQRILPKSKSLQQTPRVVQEPVPQQ